MKFDDQNRESGGVENSSEFALACEADIAQQVRRALGKLIQEIVHALFDVGPVLHPTVHLEDVLAQPTPQLLNRIEPRGVKATGSCKVVRQQTRHFCGIRVRRVVVSSLPVRPT